MLTVDASTTYYLPLIASLSPWDGNYAWIGGSAVLYEQKSLQIDRAVGKAKVSLPCSFSVPDDSGAYSFSRGQPVTITDAADGTVFGGYIDNVTVELINPAGERRHKIVCMGMDYLAQKRTVQASFSNVNPICMVRLLADTYEAAEGVSYTIGTSLADSHLYVWADGNGNQSKTGSSTMPQTDTPINISYVGQQVASALDDLADQLNRYWFIDSSKVLWFIPTNTIVAPFTLQASDILFSDHPTLQSSGDKYRNRMYVANSLGLKSSVESFKGDGTKQSFTLSMPCNSKPSLAVNGVTVSGSAIGILGVDTGKNWWWNAHSNIITQDATLSPLNPGDSLQVTYTGEYAQTTMTQNTTAQTALAAIEGTSGIVEAYAKISLPLNQADATTYNSNQLTTNCATTKVFTFKTLHAGLREGMWLPMGASITQWPGMPTAMLITNYSIEDAGISDTGELYKYSITAVTGPLQLAWTLI